MATGADFGKIEEFSSNNEDWSNYVERLNHFFKANSIPTNQQKQSMFLSVFGPSTYKLLRSLVSPEKPGDKSFKDLVKKLTDHFNPTPSEIVQCFKFHGRFRQTGESIAAYVAELRALAEFCNFGATLEDMLREQLVWGIKNDSMQQRLLQESTLKYKKALELAQGLETAAQNVLTLKNPKQEAESPTPSPQSQDVHKVNPTGKAITCHRSGKPGHIAPKCHFKDTICYQCGKKGHLNAVCRSKPKGNAAQRKRGGSHRNVDKYKRMIFQMKSSPCIALDHIKTQLLTLHCVCMTVDKKSIEMELDTGAAVSLMSEATL